MRGIGSKGGHSSSRGWRPPKPCFGQPGVRLCTPLGLCRGTCFPAFAWHFPHFVQLSKKLQYPSGCQGNISPWWDVRDDRGRVLILKSCQATQWVGDITGAMADGHVDRRLQTGSTLRSFSSESLTPCYAMVTVASLNWKVGLSNGDRGGAVFPRSPGSSTLHLYRCGQWM